MKPIHTITLTLIFSSLSTQADLPELAVVTVPVADLAGHSLSFFKGSPAQKFRENAFAPDKGQNACLRIHQLRYNEVVEIISDSAAEEVECKASNFYYLDKNDKKRSNFWMLKEQLLPLKKLAKKIDVRHIPAPIKMDQQSRVYNKNILTLIQPWLDDYSKKAFSVGTRFVRDASRDTKDGYAVYYIDCQKMIDKIVHIPRKKALVNYPATKEKAIELFVRLLKTWASSKSGIVPYVYGGCSFAQLAPDKGFYRDRKRKYGHLITFWQRKGTFKTPLVGFDCSGLVLVAAQIVGLPYYCKNTHALVECLRPLAKHEVLEVGDLLWYNHHVMVVSNVKENLLIEAVGYDSGFGKLHEIEVKKLFRGIDGYNGLIKAHHEKHPLIRLNSNGKPYKIIQRLKILKLNSLWR